MQRYRASPNLLPGDGIARYYGKIMSAETASRHFQALLLGLPWQNDEAVMFGRRMITARKVAWYGDRPFSYTYSRTTKEALPWNSELLALKRLAERITGSQFNSCLANLYHTGSEGVAWHSDDEKTLAANAAIASLTFGAERLFAFKHKRTKETQSLILEHGSLLTMEGSTQTHWLHRLPPRKKVTGARINLTFRSMLQEDAS